MKWKLLLNLNGLDLCEVEVSRGIFQRDKPVVIDLCYLHDSSVSSFKKRLLINGVGRDSNLTIFSSWMTLNSLEKVMIK